MMPPTTRFLPGFQHQLFGRAPVRRGERLARQLREMDGLCLTHLHTLFGGMIPSWLASFKAANGANSRARIYTPLVTFWAFLSQVLDPDGCCRRAVTRVQTLCSALRLPLPGEDTGAYCTARTRLPIRLLYQLFWSTVEHLGRRSRAGRRIVVMDGTSVRLPDTAKNAAAYSYTPRQPPGCGFPLLQLLALFDLHTGAWLAMTKSKTKAHDARLAWRLLKHLRTGDILLADRAFCSYAFIAACQAKGVDVVMRLHQARDPQLDRSQRLGPADWLMRWARPAQAPKGQPPGRYRALPAHLSMRLVHVQSHSPGHRTTELKIVSTLLDPAAYSAPQLATWYLRRWQIELCFDDLKTSLGMDVLRCKSPHMVARELLLHMIAYNLVRHLMQSAESSRELDSRHTLSFKGTLDRLDQWQATLWSAPTSRQARQRHEDLLWTIAHDEVPERPGRKEPRVTKARQNKYTLMTKPRHLYNLADDLAHAS